MAIKKAEEQEQKKEVLVEEEWNRIVYKLIDLEKSWVKYRDLYSQQQVRIPFLHPLDQRIMERLWQKQKFMFFLEAMARESRLGFEQLLTGGN